LPVKCFTDKTDAQNLCKIEIFEPIMTTLQKISAGIVALCAAVSAFAANPQLPLLNEPVDISGDFRDFSNLYYLADRLANFDPASGSGKITCQRSQYFTRQAFDNMLAVIKPVAPNEFPENQYAANPSLPFAVEFISPKTFRLRLTSGPQFHKKSGELMLAPWSRRCGGYGPGVHTYSTGRAGEAPKDDSWLTLNSSPAQIQGEGHSCPAL
jgi:hypothetical protein